MKIGYYGDGPWAHQAIDRMIDDSKYSIQWVVTRFGSNDDYLKQKAKDIGVPHYEHPNVNQEDFIQEISRLPVDLMVSMSFDQIIKRHLFQLPPLGFINCHAGALPFYRGRNCLNWAIINGEKQFGVTVHYIDEGVDTGDIIRQDFVPIAKDDTYATVLQKAHDQCADTLIAALNDFVEGKVERKSQAEIDSKGSYFPRRIKGDEIINWKLPAEDIYNFIRAITVPGPCARTYAAGNEIAIIECDQRIQESGSEEAPGTILSADDKGFLVQTGAGAVKVTRASNPNSQVDSNASIERGIVLGSKS